MPIAHLNDRAAIAVTGKDAKAFLQGLITNDMEKAADVAVYAALLTPQGKVLFDFFVVAQGEGYLLDASAAQADELLKRLKMYRLRAAVDLAARAELAVFAGWGGAPMKEAGAVFADPRLAALGWREIAAAGEISWDASTDDYHACRLSLGVPDSGDTAGEFLLDANGEELHAVDFRKGCFVGQEVTARMKHKAQPRKRMVAIDFEGDAALPPPGTKLIGPADAEIGEIKTGAGCQAIASVRIDRLGGARTATASGRTAIFRRSGYAVAGIEDMIE